MIRWQRMRSRRKREKRRSWRRRHDITFCSANVCGRLRSLSRSVLPFGGALRAPSSAAGTFCRSQGSLILEWDFGHGSRYRAWPIFLCPWPDFCLLWEPCSFLWGEEQSEKKKKKKKDSLHQNPQPEFLKAKVHLGRAGNGRLVLLRLLI